MLSVVHDVIIEGCTTQRSIQIATGLSRSVVSEALIDAVERGFLEEANQLGSRKKIYTPSVTIPQLVLGYYDRGLAYARQVSDKLSQLISKTPDTREAQPLLGKLKRLSKGYEVAGKFSRRTKAEMIREMMASNS